MDSATRPEGSLNDVHRGWDVYSSDEQKVGAVQETGADQVVMRSSLFPGEDRIIPSSGIRRITHNRVYLNVPKDAVAGQGWARVATDSPGATRSASDGPPSIPESIGTPGLTGVVEEGGHLVRAGSHQETAALDTKTPREPVTESASPAAAITAPAVPRIANAGATPPSSRPAGFETTPADSANQRLRSHEEQLQVNKERVPTGAVQAPVQREEVVIERMAAVPVSGLPGLWQRLCARPALPLALTLGVAVLALLLILWRNGRIGPTQPELQVRVVCRPVVRA